MEIINNKEDIKSKGTPVNAMQRLFSPEGGLCLYTVPSLRKAVRKITLRAEGRFTVKYTEAARVLLLELLDNHDQVIFDLKAVTEFDLAAVQLLNMAVRSQESAGKTLAIEPGLKPADYDLFAMAGLSEILTSKNLK